MATHRPRFCTKVLIGMSAVTGLTVMVSTPARAETIELLCSLPDVDRHVYVDTDQRSVVYTIADKRYGPFSASISETFITWTETTGDWDRQGMIDRVAGTMRDMQSYRGEPKSAQGGKCRRATQKF